MNKKSLSLIDSAQSTFANFVSLSRNAYLTSSIGVAIITFANFSKNLKKHSTIIKFIGITILIYSFGYGLKNAYNFQIYINYLRKNEKKLITNILHIKLNQWQRWIYFMFIYPIIIFIFAALVLY